MPSKPIIRLEVRFATYLSEERTEAVFGEEFDFEFAPSFIDEPDDTFAVLRDVERRRLKVGGVIKDLNGHRLLSWNTPAEQVIFLEKLMKAARSRGVDLDPLVLIVKFTLQHYLIPGNLPDTLKRLNLNPTFEALDSVVGTTLANTSMSLRSGPDPDKSYFSVILNPGAGNPKNFVSVSMVADKDSVSSMIELLKSFDGIIKELENIIRG